MGTGKGEKKRGSFPALEIRKSRTYFITLGMANAEQILTSGPAASAGTERSARGDV